MIKIKNKLQKPYFIDFWPAYYQGLLITSLKKFIELNIKIDMIIENVKGVGLNTKIVSSLRSTQALKAINGI